MPLLGDLVTGKPHHAWVGAWVGAWHGGLVMVGPDHIMGKKPTNDTTNTKPGLPHYIHIGNVFTNVLMSFLAL